MAAKSAPHPREALADMDSAFDPAAAAAAAAKAQVRAAARCCSRPRFTGGLRV